MEHNWYTTCAKCGKYGRKKAMQLIYSGKSSMPPNILCYLCERCYCEFLDKLEVAEDGSPNGWFCIGCWIDYEDPEWEDE